MENLKEKSKIADKIGKEEQFMEVITVLLAIVNTLNARSEKRCIKDKRKN